MSFANLRKNKTNALASLQEKVQTAAAGSEGGGNKDPRKFKLTYDKTTKIGSATIRFLPFGNGDRLPWAEWIEFSFKGKGGSYWERSLKAIGKDDPVAELNHLQWERGLGGDKGADRTAVRSRGRRLRYSSNIVVINDPANPDNNGKVFLFEYGPAIHKKIIAAMVPEYADQAPVPVYDMWEGATFRLRTKDKSSYLNYDDSTFDPPSVLHQDDNVLETFYNGMHDLTEFEAETNYKSFEELDKNMRKVLGAAYCASILDEEFTPEDSAKAAAGGSNPFAGKTGGGQKPTGQQTPVEENIADPFANNGGNSTAEAGTDPFANATSQTPSESNDDPFADLDM